MGDGERERQGEARWGDYEKRRTENSISNFNFITFADKY